MINLEHKLTVDDLVVNYLAEKTKKGFINGFEQKEFLDFLTFFKSHFEVMGDITDYNTYIENFIKRKNKRDWSDKPHITFQDGVVKPTYEFSSYDESVINTYFKSRKDKENIIKAIMDYLKENNPKPISSSTIIGQDLESAKLFSATLFLNIWSSYTNSYIDEKRWPSQCKNIYKYLIEDDLAPRIEIPSIKQDLLKFYNDSYTLVGAMQQSDDKLEISSYSNGFLAYANYLNFVNNLNQKELLKYLSDMDFTMNFSIDEIKIVTVDSAPCYYEDDYDYISKKHHLKQDEKAKQLVKVLK